jgi:hypothetical protein
MKAIISVLRYNGRMAFGRRTFFQLLGGFCFVPEASAVWAARDLVRRGFLGNVVFCRASRRSMERLGFVLDGAIPVCEWIEGDELVLCGTEATLVMDRLGYRRFAWADTGELRSPDLALRDRKGAEG